MALDVEHIAIKPGGMSIELHRSKTDQEGAGSTKFVPKLGGVYCPVSAYRQWIAEAEIESGAVFRPITKTGGIRNRRLTNQSVALIVKRGLLMAGLPHVDAFSGHSLRAGFVTTAAENGAAEWKIQKVTGHKSTQVLRRYIRTEDKAQSDAVNSAFGRTPS